MVVKRLFLGLSALTFVAAQDGALPADQQVQGHDAPPQQMPGEIKGDPAHAHHDPAPHDPAHPSNQDITQQHAVGETGHESGG